MKIDFNQIERILKVFEEHEYSAITSKQLFDKLELNDKEKNDCEYFSFYMQLLKDQGLIECLSTNPTDKDNFGITYTGNGQFCLKILNFRLTSLGHQTLESLENKEIWEKIKERVNMLGIEGLKQIPSLAINLLSKL